MKIALTASGTGADASLDRRFGRAPHFIVFDQDDGSFVSIDNRQNLNSAQGAGIQSALTVAGSGAAAVITGHCGPKAFRVLREAGIAVYNCEAGTVAEALELYRSGQLTAAQAADVEGHWA